jgi:hypothetical protein
MSQFNFETVKASDQPKNNIELMIDIETLGLIQGSPVVTIGAVLFDIYSSDSSEELLRRSLLIRFDISDAIKHCNKTAIDGGTIRWWFEQSDAAIKALVTGDEPAVSMQEGLNQLWRYCHERGSFVAKEFFDGICDLPRTCRYWAKDPDFDMQLLRHYYEGTELSGQAPWKFWECRSVRTVQDLAWPNGSDDRPTFEIPGVAHDARWDAIQQAMTVQAAIRRLGLAKDQDVQFKSWKGVKPK